MALGYAWRRASYSADVVAFASGMIALLVLCFGLLSLSLLWCVDVLKFKIAGRFGVLLRPSMFAIRWN